ncbi:unnamed protein product [Sphagnum troendelagicum]|uniref:Uncharacterized protein n=1 Tax=Sphagnum troendelagicum TaxID=128251 RepID=A0ABP0TFU0_9BRYO
MAWQKMALLAVAGVLCMSALLNGAEASASSSNPSLRNATQASGVNVSSSWKLIDTLRTSSSWTNESLPVLIVNELGGHIYIFLQLGNGNVVTTSFNVNNNVANINGELEWLNCNQLLAMDEIAAADEDVALSGRKLLNH